MAKKAASKSAGKRAQQKKPAPRKAAKKAAAQPAKRVPKVDHPQVKQTKAKTVPVAHPAQQPENQPTGNSGKRVGRVENLTPFQPGQSGNPNGRPKSKPLTDAIRAELAKKDPNDKQGRTFAELIAEAAVTRALKGDPRAFTEIADRVEGKVTQPISGPDEGPIDINLSGKTPEERDSLLADVATRLGFQRT